MSERRRNHGSRARIPGALFRALAGYYLEKKGDEITREGLARQIAQRLADDGIEYHVRTVRRQILGVVASVPPEVELTLKEIAVAGLGFESEAQLMAALAEKGHVFDTSERLSPYVAIERLHPLTELWLFHNRGKSKRTLARRLAKDLNERGVKLSFDSLQGKLAGKGHLVRREVIDQLVDYLAPQGVHSEEEALAYKADSHDEISQSLEGRQFTSSKRFRQLCRLWQLKHREGSSRRLAQLLRERLEEQEVHMSITHLQRAIGGKTPRIRRDLMVAMESLLLEALPEGRTIEQELEGAQWDGTRNLDLAWVSCAPIAAMAREWLEDHPGTSMRQLAIKVAATIRRMGYASSHNTIQPILGAWKKKTRGYVYRAMLKQFPNRGNERIPEDHLIGPVPGAEFLAPKKTKTPSLNTFIKNAKKHLPEAKSPHFARLMALRAESIYGIDASEAQRRIEGRRKTRSRPAQVVRISSQAESHAESGVAADDGAIADETGMRLSPEPHAGDAGEAPMARWFDSF